MWTNRRINSRLQTKCYVDDPRTVGDQIDQGKAAEKAERGKEVTGRFRVTLKTNKSRHWI